MRHKVVGVRWGDAYIDTDDFSSKKAQKFKPCYRTTVGFLIAENDYGLVLATDEYHKKKDDVSTSMFIPWGMVEEWWDYKEL